MAVTLQPFLTNCSLILRGSPFYNPYPPSLSCFLQLSKNDLGCLTELTKLFFVCSYIIALSAWHSTLRNNSSLYVLGYSDSDIRN